VFITIAIDGHAKGFINMMKKMIVLLPVLFFFLLGEQLFSQNSGAVYRRTGILNGNQVKTVFGNWGVIGQPSNRGPRGAWIYDTNGYIGDVSPLVGAEIPGYEGIYWVIDCPVDRPSSGGFDESNTGVRQAFEPVDGYFNENQGSPAISGNKNSWPPFWPDKLDDPDDPGWPGSWNGLFGKVPNADLETYFVMDDNADNEFNVPSENAYGIAFRADSTRPDRNGLALVVKVRGLQWAQILAQDNIFWVYEITNTGTTLYPRTVFGMLVGTYVGVTGADDSPQEYDDDWSFFDVNYDLTYTGDFPLPGDASRNPFWQGPVGLVGYAFLESPGNPYDGIDNDNDIDRGDIVTAPLFNETDFAQTTITNSPVPGFNQRNKIVLINPDNFERTVLTFPANQDTFLVDTLGYQLTLISGVTKLVEGNVVVVQNEERVNPNSYDGKDNDLDGLIDENYYLHYRQRRVDQQGNVLFDIVNPVHYIDYINGQGIGDPMIDERRDDGIDNDGDWVAEFDDVGADGLPNTGDLGENDGFPTAGEPNFDQTDKDESDQIGLSSFEYFVPAGTIAMHDDNEMWRRLQPGYFDVPESFQNGKPTQGEDGDFVYGTGYFPLTPKQTERLSLALIYGWTLDDLVKKLETVQKIYNADYRFPVAPQKPVLTTVAGNDSVTLYWDRTAESSFDPVLREFDFEGYKIYRSTDPNFNDVFTITNSAGNAVAYKPIAQYDAIDGIAGYFDPPGDIYQILQGWAFDLGDDTGLPHSYVDTDVQNGRTYYYAVVSYDKGDQDGGIIPSECTKKITQESSGEITVDDNTAVVTPSAPVAGYMAPKKQDQLAHEKGDGFGTVTYKILDPTALTGHDYEVYFWDTSNDGIDNNNNWTEADDVGADGIANTGDKGEGDGKPTPGEPNLDYNDPKELEAVTTRYAVKDLTEYSEDFFSKDTNFVDLQRNNLVEGSVIVQDGVGNVLPESSYEIDYENGQIRGAKPGDLQQGVMYLIRYQYQPVYFSPYIEGTPYVAHVEDADHFDGITLMFDNIWKTESDTSGSGWNMPQIQYDYDQNFETIQHPVTGKKISSVFFPSNYEIRMYDHVVDTTSDFFQSSAFPPSPRKFEIVNTTGNYKIEYVHNDADHDMFPSPLERIIFLEKDPEGNFTIYTWQIILKADPGYTYQFQGGEILKLFAKFPFNKFDLFTFKTEVPEISQTEAHNSLDEIKVVPNPYIVAHPFEPPLPPGVTSGRGERLLYFTHLPMDSKIYIFTARGEHLITLDGKESKFNGTVTWNLKTKENLDIAYGVYFYVVKSPVGEKRGKFAVIK
jgi:hypothetical protein